MRSEAHRIYTEQCIAYHFGELQWGFQYDTLEEAMVENKDEAHFFDLDNHTSLGVIEQTKVNYAEILSRGKGMTVVLRISGGVEAKVEAPFIKFWNRNSN